MALVFGVKEWASGYGTSEKWTHADPVYAEGLGLAYCLLQPGAIEE
jgi:hypothetical protein